MPKNNLMAVALFGIACSAVACRGHRYHQPNTAADLAANVVDMASEALLKDDGGPKWDELDRRLDVLFANNTKEADEAVVILVSFYIGEHECEEVDENVVSRGRRMIPLVERYLREAPASLLHEYPRRVRLERETTIGHLEEDLKLLQAQASANGAGGTHETYSADSVAGTALAEQKSDGGVRIHCPPPSAHPVKVVRPVYPESAKETHVQGRVSLVCLVSKGGTVKSVEVKAGHPLLIKAATDAVSQWKFKPLLLNGKAVEFEAPVNVDFQLPKVQKNPAAKPSA